MYTVVPMARSLARRLEDITLAVIDVGLASRVATETVDRVVSSGLIERSLDRLLANGMIERSVDRVFDEHQVIDEIVDRLLESDDLWRLVNEIAESPAVTAAITRQSVGFADQVAAGVRDATRGADSRIESAARRVLRRAPAAPTRTHIQPAP